MENIRVNCHDNYELVDKKETYKGFLEELQKMCSGEIIDGICVENDRADAHISCDETGNTFNIYVESFSEEYAKDMMDDVLEMFEKLLT